MRDALVLPSKTEKYDAHFLAMGPAPNAWGCATRD